MRVEAAEVRAAAGAPARSRCSGCCCCCRGFRATLSAHYDRLWYEAIRMSGFMLPDPLPPQAAPQVRRLRGPCWVATILTAVAGGLQTWCVLVGWMLILNGIPSACQSLKAWIFGYSVALTLMPLSFVVAGPLVVLWAANGLLIRSASSHECETASPELWAFVDNVMVMSLATCGLMAVVFIIGWWMRSRLRSVMLYFGSNGPAIEEVVRNILNAPCLPGPPRAAECSICLEDSDGSFIEGDGSANSETQITSSPVPASSVAPQSTRPDYGRARWRMLRCGHWFHEHCLLEWLRRARRCPLCRLDLHAAYLQPLRPAAESP